MRTKIRFATYIQHDQMDCGSACLKIVSKYHNKTFSLKYLRDRCYITREGVSLFDIGRAAEDIGYRTLAIKVQFADLQNKMPLPVVVHWKQNHFVVVYKISRTKVYVSDPGQGLISFNHKEFCDTWELPGVWAQFWFKNQPRSFTVRRMWKQRHRYYTL